MLKQRILTALVLLAILLPAAASRAEAPFAWVTMVLLTAGGWEWGRLNGAGRIGSVAMAGVVAAVALAMLMGGWVQQPPAWLWQAATLLWVLGGAWTLRQGVAAWPAHARGVRWLAGIVALGTAWLAIACAHGRGANFLLSMLALVWMADIAAYFGGRRFGRRKLAPAISPGKSWEGVLSGVLGVLLLAGLWLWFDAAHAVDSPSLYTELVRRLGWVPAGLAVLLLSGMSVVGDLVESLVKRSAGAKDSSALLPGHGGVLDRVDALLPVCPIAMGLISAWWS